MNEFNPLPENLPSANGVSRNGTQAIASQAVAGQAVAGQAVAHHDTEHAERHVYPVVSLTGSREIVPAAPRSRRVEHDDDDSFDVSQVIALFQRRWKILLATFLVVFIAGAVYTKMQRPIYEATATILVSTSNANNSAGNLSLLRDLMGNSVPSSMGTQIEILRSTPVQRGALHRLSVGDQKRALEFFRTDIRPLRDAEIIAVSVTSYHRDVSTELAQALCDEYMHQNQVQNRADVRQATQYVSDQLTSVRQRLDIAAKRLKDYQQSHGTVDLSEESRTRIAQLSQIESDRRGSLTERLAGLAQIKDLQAQIAAIPASQVAPSLIVRRPAVEAMKAQLTQLELQRIAALREYLPTHRVVTNIDEQITAINRRLRDEAKTEVTNWTPSVNPTRQALALDAARIQGGIWAQEARLQALDAAAARAREALSQLPEQAYNLGRLTMDQSALQQTYHMLNEKYQTLRISEEARVANARMVAAAEATPFPVSPQKARNLLMAALAGLVLAACLALLVDQLDDRIHAADDAEAASGLPVLVHLPLVTGKGQQSLATPGAKHALLLESYRMLRASLGFATIDEPLRSLAITSSQPGEGKSTCAVNLAIITALDGKRVILVDCDLRRPTLHQRLSVNNRAGFTNVLSGTTTLGDALQETTTPGLRVLTSGPLPPNPTELLNSRTGRAFLKSIVQEADFVVFDTPPALLIADAQIVASIADATLLIVSAKEAGRREIARTSDLLAQTGSRLLGVVLNKVTKTIGGAYGAYKYRSYEGYFGSTELATAPVTEVIPESRNATVAASGERDK